MRRITMRHMAVLAAMMTATALGASAQTTAPAGPPATMPAGARGTPEGWFAPAKEDPALPKRPDKPRNVFIIPVHGEISQALADRLEMKILQCRGKGADLVIFDMNTPGGEIDAMFRIFRMISDELPRVRTVAYVNPEAISAGAIISLACNDIVMKKGSVIGDAVPIHIDPQRRAIVPIPPDERAKLQSYLQANIRAVVERNQHDMGLCKAMIDRNVEVWQIRRRATGELKLIEASEKDWQGKVAGAPGGPPAGQAGIEWDYVRSAAAKGMPVTLTATEAVRFGLARTEVPDEAALEALYQVKAPPTRLDDTKLSRLVYLLTTTGATVILIGLGLFLAYGEMHAPGHGLSGVGSLLCFGALFASRYVAGLANAWEIGLFAIGAILILVEIFVFPGIGITGVVGALFCLVAMVAVMIPNAPNEAPLPRTSLEWTLLNNGMLAAGLGIVLAIGLGALLMRFFPKIPLANKIMLPEAPAVADIPAPEGSPILRIREGDLGVVTGMCRPVGVVRFGDDFIDAMTEGEPLEAGTNVRVIRREGNRLLVEKV